MLADVLLALVIVALLVERHLNQRAVIVERRHLLNRIVANDPTELIALEREPGPPRKRQRDDEESMPPIPIGL